MRRRLIGAVLVASSVWIATPGVASAHGITSTGRSVPSFVGSGFVHMVTGWDHLAFIAGVLILAGSARRAAALISLFAVGHSTTLLIAALAGWRVNPDAVDAVIALSVVFVAGLGLRGRPEGWRWFGAAVLAFGLVHGLGLATRLQDVGLPREGLLARVIAFNVGVEGGQLAAIALMAAVGIALRRYVRWSGWRPASNLGLLTVGLVAVWLLFIGWVDQRQTAAHFQASGCTITERTELLLQRPVARVPKQFYGPTETAPDDSFAYVLPEGYLIVQYSPRLSPRQLDALRDFVGDRTGKPVAAGAAPDQTEPVKAVTSYGTMTCPRFDLESLTYFTDRWLANPRSRPQF